MRALILSTGLLLAAALPAQAEVANSAPTVFELRFTQSIAKSPAAVWRSVVNIGRWWDSEHTFFGDARRLRIDPRAGGCFCETSGGASVEHARVIYVKPAETLRMQGSLGPLQDMGATGIMTFALAGEGGATRLTMVYRVTAPGGDLTPLAPLVDAVLGQQFARLVRYTETGART